MSQIDSVMSDLRNLDSNMDVLEVALNEEKEKIHERIDGHGNDTLITLYENVEGEGQQALDRNGDLEMKRRLAKAYLDRLPSGIKTLGWDKDIKKLKSAMKKAGFERKDIAYWSGQLTGASKTREPEFESEFQTNLDDQLIFQREQSLENHRERIKGALRNLPANINRNKPVFEKKWRSGISTSYAPLNPSSSLANSFAIMRESLQALAGKGEEVDVVKILDDRGYMPRKLYPRISQLINTAPSMAQIHENDMKGSSAFDLNNMRGSAQRVLAEISPGRGDFLKQKQIPFILSKEVGRTKGNTQINLTHILPQPNQHGMVDANLRVLADEVAKQLGVKYAVTAEGVVFVNP